MGEGLPDERKVVSFRDHDPHAYAAPGGPLQLPREGVSDVGALEEDLLACPGHEVQDLVEDGLVSPPVQRVDREAGEPKRARAVAALPGGEKVLLEETRGARVLDPQHEVVPGEVVIAEVDSP